MKYRTRVDIMAMILQSAMRGASRTRLMYGAYLSYAQLKEYISLLQSKGLLVYEEGLQIYRPTPKALQFLNIYDEFRDLFSVDGNKMSQSEIERSQKMKIEHNLKQD